MSCARWRSKLPSIAISQRPTWRCRKSSRRWRNQESSRDSSTTKPTMNNTEQTIADHNRNVAITVRKQVHAWIRAPLSCMNMQDSGALIQACTCFRNTYAPLRTSGIWRDIAVSSGSSSNACGRRSICGWSHTRSSRRELWITVPSNGGVKRSSPMA